MITYRNYSPVAWPPNDWGMPVPGWGMHPVLAGNRMIAVGASPDGLGAFGYDMVIKTPIGNQTITVPLEDMIASAMPQLEKQFVDKIWPQLQPKLRKELEDSVASAKADMRKDLFVAAAVVIGAIGIAAAWTKKR